MANITQFGYGKFEYINKINQYIAEEKYIQAIKFSYICLKHAKEDNSKIELIIAIAKCFLEIGEYGFAVNILLEGLDIQSLNKEILYLMAEALYYKNKNLASEEYYFALYFTDDTLETKTYLKDLSALYSREVRFVDNKYDFVVFDEKTVKDKYIKKAYAMLESNKYQDSLDLLTQYSEKSSNDSGVIELLMLINLEKFDFATAEKYANILLNLNGNTASALKAKIKIGQAKNDLNIVNTVLGYLNTSICSDFSTFIELVKVIVFANDYDLLKTFIVNHKDIYADKYVYLHITALLFISNGSYKTAEDIIQYMYSIYDDNWFAKYATLYLKMLNEGNRECLPLMNISDELSNFDYKVTPYLRVPMVYKKIISQIYQSHKPQEFCEIVSTKLRLANSIELFELLISLGDETYIRNFFATVYTMDEIDVDDITSVIDKLENKNIYIKGIVMSILINEFEEREFLLLNNFRQYLSTLKESTETLTVSPILQLPYAFAYGICSYSAKCFEDDLHDTLNLINKIYAPYLSSNIDYRIYAAMLYYFLNLNFDEEFNNFCYEYFGVKTEAVREVINDVLDKDTEKLLSNRDVIIDRLDSLVSRFQNNINN